MNWPLPPYHEASANTVWECQHGKPIYKCQARWGAPEVSLGGMATVHCVPLSFKQNNRAIRGPIASHGLSFLFEEICEPALGLYHNKHTKKNWHPSVRMNRKRPKKYLKRVLVLDHYGMESSRVLHEWVRICAVTSKKTCFLGSGSCLSLWKLQTHWDCRRQCGLICLDIQDAFQCWVCVMSKFYSIDFCMALLHRPYFQQWCHRIVLGDWPGLVSIPALKPRYRWETGGNEERRQTTTQWRDVTSSALQAFYLFKLETLGEGPERSVGLHRGLGVLMEADSDFAFCIRARLPSGKKPSLSTKRQNSFWKKNPGGNKESLSIWLGLCLPARNGQTSTYEYWLVRPICLPIVSLRFPEIDLSRLRIYIIYSETRQNKHIKKRWQATSLLLLRSKKITRS